MLTEELAFPSKSCFPAGKEGRSSLEKKWVLPTALGPTDLLETGIQADSHKVSTPF